MIFVHPMTVKGVGGDREKRRFMAPILEQLASLIGHLVNQLSAVWTETRKERHVVRSDDHVHRVKLEKPDTTHDTAHKANVDRTDGRLVRKALGAERHPTRLIDADSPHSRRT